MNKSDLQRVKRNSAIITLVIILAAFFFGNNDYTTGLTFGMRFVAFTMLVATCVVGIIKVFNLPKE